MKPLSGKWLGIVGGTNIGKVSGSITQAGQSVTGQFIFQDLFTVPLQTQVQGVINGRWLDASLSRFALQGAPPTAVAVPTSGRKLGLIENDGEKITGFWITNVLTAGGFILSREG
jgi:hypothetical protein